MDILVIIGVISVVVCFGVLFHLSGLGKKRPSIGSISLFVCFFASIFLFGFGIQGTYTGDLKTSIKAGSYAVVGYAESKDGQFYYMILEQKDGVEAYTLSKDMIDIAQSGAKGGTLEVVEKSGLRKAILYLPISGGVNPSP